LNGAHMLVVYAADVNLLDENMNTINKSKESVLHAKKKVLSIYSCPFT